MDFENQVKSLLGIDNLVTAGVTTAQLTQFLKKMEKFMETTLMFMDLKNQS